MAQPATSSTTHTPAHHPTLHTTHHRGWYQPIPALHHTPPTTSPITHHATLPHATPPKHTEEGSPIPAQHTTHHATPPHPHVARVETETQNTNHGDKGGGSRGCMMHLPQRGLSAGSDRPKVVICPHRGKDPASGHPRAQKPLLGRDPSTPVWDDRLDTPDQRRGLLTSSMWTRHRAVIHGKSGGSVGTTDQGKGKGSGEGKMGQGGRGRT